MKTKGTFFSIVLMLVSTFVFASGAPSQQLAVVKSGDALFKVIYEGKSESPITLQLSASDGSLVYSKKLNSLSGFICPLNFDGMKSGDYLLKVIQGSEASTATITYSTNHASPFAQIKAVADRKYAVLVPNAGTRISVAIYDASNNVVASYVEKVKGSYGKVFDLSRMPAAPYTFVVSDDHQVIQSKTL